MSAVDTSHLLNKTPVVQRDVPGMAIHGGAVLLGGAGILYTVISSTLNSPFSFVGFFASLACTTTGAYGFWKSRPVTIHTPSVIEQGGSTSLNDTNIWDEAGRTIASAKELRKGFGLSNPPSAVNSPY